MHFSLVLFFRLLVTVLSPPTSTLFPYTTLFRSGAGDEAMAAGEERDEYLFNDFALADDRFAEFGINLRAGGDEDRKSTRLNSSHLVISYAVFCLKKKHRSSPTTT